MSKVKFFSIIAGLMTASSVMAANPAAFEAEKSREIANMQERLQIIQERLTCVQAATDRASLKACNKTAKSKRQELGAKIKDQMADKKAERDAKKAAAPAPEATPAPAAAPEAAPATTTP